jgi:hypothetical protein
LTIDELNRKLRRFEARSATSWKWEAIQEAKQQEVEKRKKKKKRKRKGRGKQNNGRGSNRNNSMLVKAKARTKREEAGESTGSQARTGVPPALPLLMIEDGDSEDPLHKEGCCGQVLASV